MLTFIKVNGVYIGFWLVMGVLGLIGVYYAVFRAVLDAIRIANG